MNKDIKKTIGDHPKLLDNIDLAAIGIAVCGVILFLSLITGNY